MKAFHYPALASLAFAWASGSSSLAAVTLHPGDNIQSLVAASGSNTVFLFSAGIYTNQNITPKAGDVFDGQGAAILDGANTATRAFGGAVDGVILRNLTIQHYKSAAQNAAVDCALGSAWIVTNCVIQSNVALGVKFGTNSVIVHNQINGNGEAGFAGGGNGWLIRGNQVHDNNTSHQNWNVDGGGGKITGGASGLFDGNSVTNNFGPGIWLSSNANNIVITSNLCIGNYGAGVAIEVSKLNTISNNLCFGNGLGATNWGAAQILLSTAASNVVQGNILSVPFNNNTLYAVFIMDQARTNSGIPAHAAGNDISSNHVWLLDTKTGIHGCAADDGYAVQTNNNFHHNAYHVADASVPYFLWETNDTLPQGQAAGHETGSTIDTNLTPQLAIAQTTNRVALSWPSWALNFKAWNRTNLSSASWSSMTNPLSITITDVQTLLSTAAGNGADYFRLTGPGDSLTAGLIAHYTFDEQCTNSAPGCVIDYSGLGNNGTLGSATSGTNPQAPIWTPNGKFAGAYLYNGIVLTGNIVATVGEGIFLPQGVDVDGNWTLSVWAKLNNVTNHTSSTIYSQKQSTEDCRNLLIHWEGDMDETMTLQVRDSACHELLLHNLPSNPMVAGQWMHLVGVGNNKTYSFYINGALQQSQLVTNMGSLSCNSHTIGVMYDDFGRYYNHYLDGAVDEMRIYNRALSAAEIVKLYNCGGGSSP